MPPCLAGFTAARAFAAVSPIASGISAVRAALEISVTNSLEPSKSDFLEHFVFLFYLSNIWPIDFTHHILSVSAPSKALVSGSKDEHIPCLKPLLCHIRIPIHVVVAVLHKKS